MNPQPKPKAFRSQAYLEWLRTTQPICAGFGTVEAHHCKLFQNGGMGIKPPDNDALPVPWSVHQRIHSEGEQQVLVVEAGLTVVQLRKRADDLFERWQRIQGGI